MRIKEVETRPAGYAFLLDRLGLVTMPHGHVSYVSSASVQKSLHQEGLIEETFPKRFWPGDRIGDHLEFALKYDGVNLLSLAQVFENAPKQDLIAYIRSKPTGKYARRIWFFYEFLTGQELDIPNASSGNYVEALESTKYFTLQNGENSPRHRIVNNLLGPSSFCPIVRRTDALSELEAMNLRQKCEDLMTSYPQELIRRALSYLYKKETKSSFEIENIKPSPSRTEKFVASLELASKVDFCEKEKLIELQNLIVDPRFKEPNYRNRQNYVGQSIDYSKEIIHFISPKPMDLPFIMEGLINSHKQMAAQNVSAVVHAAVTSYGFVFLHPFEDGNGRIHRFLIHNILSRQGLVPRGLMFPVSAVMLKNPLDYDASLEVFSRPLLKLIDYQLSPTGEMVVANETAHFYKYMDMTTQVEALYEFIKKTIGEELVDELSFLANYDHTRKTIQGIIDMPDRLIDLFIQLCKQNNGQLSAKKRSTHFDFLTDEEQKAMELAVKQGFSRPNDSAPKPNGLEWS